MTGPNPSCLSLAVMPRGIANVGKLTINESTISGNIASCLKFCEGLGVVVNDNSGTLTINNGTISGNSAGGILDGGEGGGIWDAGLWLSKHHSDLESG